METSLNPQNEVYLILVKDIFDMFLDSVCQNFIEYFCIDVHKRDCLKFSFFVGSLCGLYIRVTVASLNELGSVPSVSVVQNSLRSVGISSSLKIWQNSVLNPFEIGFSQIGTLLLCLQVLYSSLNSSTNFDECLENCPFH